MLLCPWRVLPQELCARSSVPGPFTFHGTRSMKTVACAKEEANQSELRQGGEASLYYFPDRRLGSVAGLRGITTTATIDPRKKPRLTPCQQPR
ncbi:hypothetical protein KY284_002986 [Solanum tuberosum]|nr:hypothetical protein KY284_002986 [Solanum tuberosum]